MTGDPRPASVAAARAARAAQRGPAPGSPALALILATVLAVAGVGAFVMLDYGMGQDPHRLVKLLLGGALLGGIAFWPQVGFTALPIITPYLPWLPKIPVPGVNTLNLLLFSVFSMFALRRIFARQPLFRPNRLGVWLAAVLGLAALSVLRGAAVPTGYTYSVKDAALALFRSGMTFAVYFIALTMVRGEKDRRRLAWAIVLALLAESLTTIQYGRNGRGGRATGSIGQANELGAFLAMFCVFAVALLPAVRRWWQRALVAATVCAGVWATVLTVSRGALLAMAVGMLYVGLRTSKVLVLALAAVLATSPFWAPDYLKDRIMNSQIEVEGSDEQTLEASAQIRIDTWRAIGEVVHDHPLDGVGFAGLAYVLPETGEALGVEVKDSAHNTYLRFLGEMGLFGLLLFVALLWQCWALAWDGMRASRTSFDRQLALGLGGATLAMAVACAFGDRFYSILITGNFWIACALVNDVLLERAGAPA